MNEFHLHLNDDFEYNPEGLSTKTDTLWTGVHRLESDVFPGLTDKKVYSGEKFEYFNEEYADPFYTKEEYRALEALANSRGINLLAEFDTPSHSTAYVEYAKENPDNIEWLGEINTTTSSAFNNKQMLALDVNSANATEKQHALNARKFIENLYADYLGGDDPVFTNDTVHVGADEYWDKSNPEAFRGYVNFLSDLMASYNKTARMWGAQLLFPGNTPISPDNIVLDIWATYEDDPIARMEEGFRVVNVPQPYLYVTPGRDHKDMIGEEYLYKNWDPVIFNGNIRAEEGEPLLLGAKTALWGDEFREGITEADTHERMLRAIAMVAEKTWGGQEEEDSYIEYQMAFEELKEGPGTEIAHNIASVSEIVIDYDLSKTKTTAEGLVVKDASGNGYDAVVKNGKIIEVDGKNMIQFDGNTLMTTPLTTLDYPYTVSFDVKVSEGNTKDSLLFAGYDGQLRVNGISDKEMTIKRSFYTQSTGYVIPADKVVNVTIVGNFQNTKIYVDGTLVKMLASADNGVGTDYWSTFVFPLEEIGKNFHGYISNIKAYNKALQPEMITDAENMEERNVALNTEAYGERFGDSPALNTGDLKRHPAWKATDGDVLDPNTYWLSSNNNNDYLMVDLGESRTVSKVAVTWNGSQYARDFKVEVSGNGKDWNVVKAITGNTETKNVITLETPQEAQFVKIQGVTRNANYYGIKEVEVFEKIDKTVRYNIVYNLNGGENHSENPTVYTETTENITLKNPTRTGYTFKGWYSDEECTNRVKTIEKGSIGDKILYAKWSAHEYSIAFKGNKSTSGSMKTLSERKYGKSYTLTKNTFKRKGYIFVGWNTKADGSGTAYADKERIKNLTSTDGKKVTLYAQWKRETYSITYVLKGGKNNNKNKESYTVTTSTITLKNPIRKGYTFKGWYSDKKCTKRVKTIKKGSTGNKTLYAKWLKK